MNITVEREPNCEALLRVEVSAEDVTGERREIVKAFRTQARIPGFRPGKIPRSVIEKRFAEQIAEELQTRFARKAYQEASEDKELSILNAKEPEDTVHHPDGALSFTTVVTLAPDVELPDYKGITIELPEREIGEEDVAKELEDLRARFGEFNDVEDRPLQSGDFGIIDYSSKMEGKPLEEALEQSVGYLAGGEDYWIEMKEDSLLPGFSAALEGAGVGEERSFALEVPEEFPVEELRGVTLDFTATVKGVKEQILPELDDELAAKIIPDKTLADLRVTIKEHLEQQLERQLQEFKVSQLLDRLTKEAAFDLPAELVTAETQGQADELVERGLGSGMSEDEIAAQQGEIFAAANQRAQSSLRTDFILQRIAEAEELSVANEELSQRVAVMAQQSGKPVKPFLKDLQKSGRLRSLHHQMLLSKTIDFLLEHAKVETTKDQDAPSTDD